MKKILFGLLILLVGCVVRAYTISDFNEVINNGDVTRDFLKQAEKDGCKTASLSSSVSGSNLNITYSFRCEQEKEVIEGGKQQVKTVEYYNGQGNISFVVKEGKLESYKEVPVKEDTDEFYDKVLQLTPFWGAEMSTKYPQIKKYIKNNHKNQVLETMKTIFDKCYMVEMGVCYSKTPGLNYTTYTGVVTLDDSGADYALKYLKKEQREINNKNLTMKVAVVGVIIAVVLLILKAMSPDPRRKRCKY
jgi:hypothetical protein